MGQNKWAWLLLLVTGLLGCDQPNSVAMGTVERDRMLLSAPVNAQITVLAVSEGQQVAEGTTLLRLDDRIARALVAQRKAELDLAQAQLVLLQKGARDEAIAAADAAYQAATASAVEAQHNYQRSRQLFSEQMIGQAELDTALANRDQTAASKQQLYQQWQQLRNGNRPEEIEQAQQQANAASAALRSAEKSLDDLTIRAPKAGVVDILPWKQGDRVPAGAQLVSLLAATPCYARVYLPAAALTKLHQGDSVQVNIDGYAQAVTGTVRHIRSQPAFTPFYALNERDRARLMYLTDIDLPSDLNLPAGVAVEVHLP
ncbi:HlyD family efflux transporter periplasmic adaptor subunit [Shewanella sp. A3A]|nr:HlyD family efflux transporter periplasmic adaptor subunit [Shewanella ferrihydritica]